MPFTYYARIVSKTHQFNVQVRNDVSRRTRGRGLTWVTLLLHTITDLSACCIPRK